MFSFIHSNFRRHLPFRTFIYHWSSIGPEHKYPWGPAWGTATPPTALRTVLQNYNLESPYMWRIDFVICVENPRLKNA